MQLHRRKIRAALALKGTNVRTWAAEKGHNAKTVYAVLAGRRSGKRSPQVVADLEAILSNHG